MRQKIKVSAPKLLDAYLDIHGKNAPKNEEGDYNTCLLAANGVVVFASSTLTHCSFMNIFFAEN